MSRSNNRLLHHGSRLAVVLAVAAACGGSGGCYERVIKAKGFGADEFNVQEPYASDSAVERAIIGPVPDGSGQKRIKSQRW